MENEVPNEYPLIIFLLFAGLLHEKIKAIKKLKTLKKNFILKTKCRNDF